MNDTPPSAADLRPAEASAPAKLILCGEHAVVYGRPAIALPLADLRATAQIVPEDAGSGLRFVAPDLDTDWTLTDQPAHPLSELAHATLAQLGYTAQVPDLTVTLRSNIPIASGLGSGAAVATALVRALAAAFGQTLAVGTVAALVYSSETRYHGTPSGIDNTVIAYEQAIWYERRLPIEGFEPRDHEASYISSMMTSMIPSPPGGGLPGAAVELLDVAEPLTLVIGDTGIRSETRMPVGAVRRRWRENTETYEYEFNRVAGIVRQVRIALDSGDITTLGLLLDENQEALELLGVSSPELEHLIAAARAAGAWGSKLSGGGWGGVMLALADERTVDAVVQALYAAGAANVLISRGP